MYIFFIRFFIYFINVAFNLVNNFRELISFTTNSLAQPVEWFIQLFKLVDLFTQKNYGFYENFLSNIFYVSKYISLSNL